MQGLLGDSWEDPRTIATMQAAAGLLGGRGNTMQRLAGAVGGYSQTMALSKREEEERKRRALQEQMLMQQLEQGRMQQQQAQAAAQRQAGIEAAYRGAIESPAQQALAGGGGPTMANAARIPDMPGGINQQKLIQGLMQSGNAQMAAQLMQPKAPEYKVVDGALVDVSAQGGPKEVYKRDKPVDMNQLMIPDGRGGYTINQQLLQAKRQVAESGAARTSVSYGTPMSAINPATGKVELVRPDNKGGMNFTGIAPADAQKPLTESQAKAAAFQSQMVAAASELSTVGNKPDSLRSQIDTRLASGATNIIASPDAQRARQAQEQWAEAYLRFKTGAASTEDEVRRNVATYFPQPGDSNAVVQQKARQRQQAMQDVGKAAGAGAAEVPDMPKPAGAPKSSGASLDDLLNKYGN